MKYALASLAMTVGFATAQAQTPTATAPKAPAPQLSPTEQWIKDVKNPAPWFKWGADLRLRNEYLNNTMSLGANQPRSEQDVFRFRGRVWTTITPVENLSLNARLSAEPRDFMMPSFTGGNGRHSGMEWRYGIFDNLNIQWKEMFNQPLTLTVGRQDILLGDFYNWWLVADGTPGDGSWSFYLDAARLTLDLKAAVAKHDQAVHEFVILPTYQVLAARGVKFEFFQKVTDLEYDGKQQIQRVKLERQVDLAVAQYDPVTWVKDTPAWPNAPLWGQLNPGQAAELQDRKINLESPWTDWQGTARVLELGADFDQVILGIPAKALELAAPTLLKLPNWRQMVDKIHTAQVQSVQLWFDKDMAGLGYIDADWGMAPKDCAANVVTYANPMFSWLDQSHIIRNEDWPGEPPKTLLMFTGILPDELVVPPYTDTRFPAEMVDRVRTLNWQWLMDNMGWFLKSATAKAYPSGIDMRLLRAVSAATDGRIKYAEQFFSAAVSPSDRYVIAVPGTEQYRLRPDGSGFGNLWLVGDWTDYGVNIGYMEGCVVSAHKAVRALRGSLGRTAARRMWTDRLADW